MSTFTVIDGNRGESLTEATARRLRGALAERRLNARKLSQMLNVSYTWMSRRINGKVSMSVEDLERIEAATGISPVYLMTGRQPDYGPGGPGSSLRPRQDSNLQPTD